MNTLQTRLQTFFEKELVDEIIEIAEPLRFNEGDLIMDYGKKIAFLPIIISGTLRVMKRDDEDREILLYYLSDNESCAMAYACCMEAKKK